MVRDSNGILKTEFKDILRLAFTVFKTCLNNTDLHVCTGIWQFLPEMNLIKH